MFQNHETLVVLGIPKVKSFWTCYHPPSVREPDNCLTVMVLANPSTLAARVNILQVAIGTRDGHNLKEIDPRCHMTENPIYQTLSHTTTTLTPTNLET